MRLWKIRQNFINWIYRSPKNIAIFGIAVAFLAVAEASVWFYLFRQG